MIIDHKLNFLKKLVDRNVWSFAGDGRALLPLCGPAICAIRKAQRNSEAPKYKKHE